MPLTLDQYADYLDTRDLPWPAAATPQSAKAKAHLVALPEVRMVTWNIYGTLLAIAGGDLVFVHPQKFIMDLALDFWSRPDNSLLVGYRRLEDIVRERTTIEHHGSKLFSHAFNPDDGPLTWERVDNGERAGRMQLFTGTYNAHRNRRAHKELREHPEELLGEFLLLNHLYCLEQEAVECETR